MKKKLLFFWFFFVGAALFAAQTRSGPTLPARIDAGFGSVPLYFIPNQGQTDREALYYAQAPGYTLWLTREGMVFDRLEENKRGEPNRSVSGLVFKNTNKDFQVIASDPTDYRVSYFFGRDESEWKTDIPTSRTIFYKNLYDGIDLKVYGSGAQIEYDWIVAPDARPERIRFAYGGGRKSRLDGEGNLEVETPAGQIVHRKPLAHQVIAGRRVDVEAAFRETEDGAYGFTVRVYDRRFPLVIDPLVLAYSTYLGGHGEDESFNLAVDPTGAVYVCGTTSSSDFPPVTQSVRQFDIYVTKLSPDGKSLIYSAFFPSSYLVEGPEPVFLGILADAKGFVYLTGATKSSHFPLKNAFQAKFGGGGIDGFILKLAKSGKSLVYSSYLGGLDGDVCTTVFADADGAAYVGGYTSSSDFPTKNAYQKKIGGRTDAFLVKVAPLGTNLVYSTFFGPSGSDGCTDLAIDAGGAVTMTGFTSSPNFPLKSAFQKTYGGGKWDAFVAQFSPEGNNLVYSSYLGGSSDDWPCDLALGADGAAYVTGLTGGSFPLKNAFQKTRKGGYEAFIAKIKPKGKALAYSSYLGGAGADAGYGIAVDGDGAAYVVGITSSYDFPIKSPYQTTLRGSADGFLTIIDPSGLKLLSSTYLGGIYRDYAWGIALDMNGNVYLCGYTNSPDFPVLGPYQKALAGDLDAFVVKFSPGDD